LLTKFRLAVDMKFAIHIHIHIHRFSDFPWIYPWISLDVSISTDAYHAYIETTAVPERPFCPGISFVKLLKINKSKKK